MLEPKDIDWVNGYKNKTHIYAVYKRPNSALKTHTDTHRLKVKGWKKVFYTKRKKAVSKRIKENTNNTNPKHLRKWE